MDSYNNGMVQRSFTQSRKGAKEKTKERHPLFFASSAFFARDMLLFLVFSFPS